MFRRGKDDEDDGGLDSLRSDFGSEDDSAEEASSGFLDDIGQSPEEEETRSKRRSSIRGNVSIIGGFFRVVGIALLSLLIFLLIGIGLAFGASALGAVELVDFSQLSIPSVIVLPTQVTIAPTSVPEEPDVAATADASAASLPTPFPTPTPENAVVFVPTPVNCPEVSGWWEEQEPIYQAFATISIEQPPQTLLATLQQMRVRRDSTLNAILTPCVDPIRTAFAAGYEHQIRAFELVNAEDLNGARSLMIMAGQAYAQAFASLWRAAITTDGSPLAAGIAAGSGATCGAEAWYQAAKTQRNALFDAYIAVDPANMPPPQIRQNQNTMAAAASNVATLQTPACAATPSNLLIGYMEDLINALQMNLGANPAEIGRLISAYNKRLMLDAWLYYLGLTP